MSALVEIIIAIVAPGLLISALYLGLLNNGLIKNSLYNKTIAASITVLVSSIYIIFSLMSWNSILSAFQSTDLTKTPEYQSTRQLTGAGSKEIKQRGNNNQANTGGNNSQNIFEMK